MPHCGISVNPKKIKFNLYIPYYYDTAVFCPKGAVMELAERFGFFNFCKNPQNFFEMIKKYGRAIQSFRRVLQLDPSSAIDYANIASNYRAMGKDEEAVKYCKFALGLDPSIDFARKNIKRLEKSRK